MKNFTYINAGNVTMVKSAISIGKAIVIINNGIVKNHAVSDDIIEKNDIYSLYDHDNLFIYRKNDRFFVARLSKFYMKDINNVIVVAAFESRHNLERKLENAGYSDSDHIWAKMASIYDKCTELQEELDNKRFEKEKAEDENSPDPEDIFDIFGEKHESSDKFVHGIPKNNPFTHLDERIKEMAMKINNCDGNCDTCDRHHEHNEDDCDDDDVDNEVRKEIMEAYNKYKEENNGRSPSNDELIDIIMEKKFKNKIDPEKYQAMRGFAKDVISNPIASLMFSAVMEKMKNK